MLPLALRASTSLNASLDRQLGVHTQSHCGCVGNVMHLCILIESQQHTHTLAHSQQSFASRDTTLRVGRPFMLSSEALATICNRDAVACKYANVMVTRNGETPTMCSAKSGECHDEQEVEEEASVVAPREEEDGKDERKSNWPASLALFPW